MRKRTGLTLAVVLAGALALGTLASYGAADNGKGKGKSQGQGSLKGKKMSGYLEVPSVSTSARGTIEVKIKNNSSIEYKLTYSGLTANATAAHIHFGQPGVDGGVVAFLCGGDKPACPATAGSIGGTILTGNVGNGAAAQGIGPGEIGELIAAMKAGFTYANVHTGTFPDGEIRGQIRPGGNGDDD